MGTSLFYINENYLHAFFLRNIFGVTFVSPSVSLQTAIILCKIVLTAKIPQNVCQANVHGKFRMTFMKTK